MVDEAGANKGLSKSRIEALADGIFAIAMTLMVFDIKLPAATPMTDLSLQQRVIQLWPRFLAYAISFIMLGVYWVGHHNQYHYIKRTDRTFLWINIFFLMGVSLVPFSTDLLGQHPMERTALVVYGLNLIVVGAVLLTHWSYATRNHRLVDPDTPAEVVRLAKYRILMGPMASVVAICLSFASRQLSLLMFALVPLLYLIPGRIDSHWLPSPGRGSERTGTRE